MAQDMIQCSVRIKYFAILNKELLISTWAVVAIIFHQTKAWKLFNVKCIMNLNIFTQLNLFCTEVSLILKE